jgi:hypothetical protein
MIDEESNSRHWIDHQKERAAVISEYGVLWQRAVAKSGVTDQDFARELLQVCAACYLDGVHRGSALALELMAKDGQK